MAFDTSKTGNLLVALIIGIVVIIIISFIGKWIWNRYLVQNVTFARPMRSWIDFLMIYILIALLFGGIAFNSYAGGRLRIR